MVRDPEGTRYLTTERPFMRWQSQLETLDSLTDLQGRRRANGMLYSAKNGTPLVTSDNI